MHRSFSAENLVQLPRLNAPGAQALGTAVVAAAQAYDELPEQVSDALEDVVVALGALNATMVRRLPPSEDSPKARLMKLQVDLAWAGTESWLAGWKKVPGLAEAQIADPLHGKLFGDGLRFTQARWREAWAGMETRLQLIDTGNLAGDFAALGGQSILARLRELHVEYGDSMGITTAVPDEEDTGPSVREALEALEGALRHYVVCATAMVLKKVPATAEISRALLKPIQSLESRPVKAAEGSEAVVKAPEEGAAKAPEEGAAKAPEAAPVVGGVGEGETPPV